MRGISNAFRKNLFCIINIIHKIKREEKVSVLVSLPLGLVEIALAEK